MKSPLQFDRILDYACEVGDLIDEIVSSWEMDLFSKTPGPAVLHNGDVKPTDLDLASILSTLAKRKAVIVLDDYKSNTANKSTNANQTVLNPAKRYGQLLRLQSNEKYFSFNVLMNDMTILNTDNGGSLGAPRAFHVIGKDGETHPGFNGIEFAADAKENDFISKTGIAVNGKIITDRFVAPTRWANFYSPYYLITKLAIARLEETTSAIRRRLKELPKPKKESGDVFSKPSKESSSYRTTEVEVPIFESGVDADYANAAMMEEEIENSDDGDFLREDLKRMEGQLAALRFQARVTDYAFYLNGGYKAGIPAYVKTSWTDFAIKKTRYKAIALDYQGRPITLRHRIRKSEVEIEVK